MKHSKRYWGGGTEGRSGSHMPIPFPPFLLGLLLEIFTTGMSGRDYSIWVSILGGHLKRQRAQDSSNESTLHPPFLPVCLHTES
jgi:hypothetical protein